MTSLQKNPLRVGGKFYEKVLNIAHRGARAYAPENTLAAFRKAAFFNCDMFELDVHKSRDGQIIVHHDDDLLRCTNALRAFPGRGSYFVSDFTYDEILKLDAGSWYTEQLKLSTTQRQSFLHSLTEEESLHYISAEDCRYYESGEVKIPTLQQALEIAQTSKMMLNIEIKTMPRMYAGLAKDVVTLVEDMKMEQCVLISSFDHQQLVKVRELNNAIATAVLTSDRLAMPASYLKTLDADAYNPGCYDEYDSLGFGSVSGELDMRGVENVRTSGRGVNVWTCNDEKHIRRLVEGGVTGILSDYPNRVRDVCSKVPRNKMFDPY